MTSIILRKECFLLRPEWKRLRKRYEQTVLGHNASLTLITIRMATTMASLNPLGLAVYKARATGSLDLPSDQLRALRMKALRFKNDVTYLMPDVDAGDIASVSKGNSENSTAGVPDEIYSFKDVGSLYHHNIFWAMAIVANTILERLGTSNKTLEAESKEFAENICRSTYFMRSFAPLGTIWTLWPLVAAFALSDWQRQEWILGEYDNLFGSLPCKVGPLSMQVAFDVFTGGPLMVYLLSANTPAASAGKQ